MDFERILEPDPPWLRQWKRVQWWLRKIDEPAPEPDYENFLWAFFQNCWHLKDWIIESNPTALSRDQIETLLKTMPYLRICRDLANRTKHSKLRKHLEDASVFQARSGSPEDSTLAYVVVTKDDLSGELAVDVAKAAAEEWKKLLTDWKLLPR